MFKFCGIIGISEIGFFNLSSTERVNQNQKKEKKIQNHSKAPNPVRQF